MRKELHQTLIGFSTLVALTTMVLPGTILLIFGGSLRAEHLAGPYFFFMAIICAALIRWGVPGSCKVSWLVKKIYEGLTWILSFWWVFANGGTNARRYVTLLDDPIATVIILLPAVIILVYGWSFEHLFLAQDERREPWLRHKLREIFSTESDEQGAPDLHGHDKVEKSTLLHADHPI